MHYKNETEEMTNGMFVASQENEMANGITNEEHEESWEELVERTWKENDIVAEHQYNIEKLDEEYLEEIERYDERTSDYWYEMKLWAEAVKEEMDAAYEAIGDLNGGITPTAEDCGYKFDSKIGEVVFYEGWDCEWLDQALEEDIMPRIEEKIEWYPNCEEIDWDIMNEVCEDWIAAAVDGAVSDAASGPEALRWFKGLYEAETEHDDCDYLTEKYCQRTGCNKWGIKDWFPEIMGEKYCEVVTKWERSLAGKYEVEANALDNEEELPF